jgi:hypothetical protein
MDKFATLLAVYLRTFATAIGLALTIVGIPFAVRLLVRWYLALEAVMVANRNDKDAINLSSRLVTGRWWRIAGLMMLTALPTLLFAVLVAVSSLGELASALARGVFTVLLLPLVAGFWTLYFLDLAQRAGIEVQTSTAQVQAIQ